MIVRIFALTGVALLCLAAAQPSPPLVTPPGYQRPTADMPAPASGERHHPVARHFVEYSSRRNAALEDCDKRGADRALAEMQYAVAELRKRLRNGRAAGEYSTINVAELERYLGAYETILAQSARRKLPERCTRWGSAAVPPAAQAAPAVSSDAAPTSLAGSWSGADWGRVTIEGADGSYRGTYSSTYG